MTIPIGFVLGYVQAKPEIRDLLHKRAQFWIMPLRFPASWQSLRCGTARERRCHQAEPTRLRSITRRPARSHLAMLSSSEATLSK